MLLLAVNVISGDISVDKCLAFGLKFLSDSRAPFVFQGMTVGAETILVTA